MKNKLLLDKTIYSRKDIEIAVQAFAELAKIEIVETFKYWELEFKECLYNEERTKKEFENYLIDYINSKGE